MMVSAAARLCACLLLTYYLHFFSIFPSTASGHVTMDDPTDTSPSASSPDDPFPPSYDSTSSTFDSSSPPPSYQQCSAGEELNPPQPLPTGYGQPFQPRPYQPLATGGRQSYPYQQCYTGEAPEPNSPQPQPQPTQPLSTGYGQPGNYTYNTVSVENTRNNVEYNRDVNPGSTRNNLDKADSVSRKRLVYLVALGCCVFSGIIPVIIILVMRSSM